MRRRLPAVCLAALLTFAVSGCGDDSGDSGEATNDASTSQGDDTTDDATDDATDGAPDDGGDDATNDTTEGAEPTETDDAGDQGGDDGDDGDNKGNNNGGNKGGDNGGNNKGGDGDDADENGAIPDDLESGEPDDPNDLPISAKVVLDTCEDVDPQDTWPAAGAVNFDADKRSVVATADVQMQGGKTATVVCAIAGSDNNPQVKAYNPI